MEVNTKHSELTSMNIYSGDTWHQNNSRIKMILSCLHAYDLKLLLLLLLLLLLPFNGRFFQVNLDQMVPSRILLLHLFQKRTSAD